MGYFAEETTIDPNTNEDFKTYANKIKSIKVEKMIVEVTSISNAPNNSVNVTTAVAYCISQPPFTENAFGATVVLNNETLTVGKTYELDAAEVPDLETILNTKEVFYVGIAGMADPVNATIGFKVYINSKITANALN